MIRALMVLVAAMAAIAVSPVVLLGFALGILSGGPSEWAETVRDFKTLLRGK